MFQRNILPLILKFIEIQCKEHNIEKALEKLGCEDVTSYLSVTVFYITGAEPWTALP
jgi:hypothetical protein